MHQVATPAVPRRRSLRSPGLLLAALALFGAAPAEAAAPSPGPPLTIRRATGPIVLDGEPRTPAGRAPTTITTWFETNVGDNVEPRGRQARAYLAYDDHFLYAGFQFDDPHPELDPRAARRPRRDLRRRPTTAA